ncbi:hypothetical protein PC129_g16028 [Phytophthora cactorum]|uniref:Peptidase S1 domain-containing protein n=1 Tax=Phytophthora cactorum TaxID=29920 RepID=A0A8T1HLY9_9STRA|nr:hypothetical protein PC113_g12055 [Phytophthora cactorum]KAG3011101.1 hypothetical protein PC120_g14647 [Phytophthora cactorum]KAG3213027.1 hypothetical protein PC129_g16028 [Phytophthora cactorum]KAG4049931.1 hypothetical protein PC123_g14807 [Phytophthora cactorum]
MSWHPRQLSSGASDRNGDPDMTSDEESGIYGESDANINKYPFRLDPCSQKVEQICVVEAFHHPLYSSTWLTYDVAVLLEKPASHQRAMFSVADGSDSKHGAMATALGGWGMVNKKTFSVSLQTVDVEIIRDDQCAKYGMTPMPCCVAELSVAKMVVLVTPEPPLIANDVIVGIMASGAGGTPDCGELPLLYTRVAHVLGYIINIVKGAPVVTSPRRSMISDTVVGGSSAGAQ